jgi:hypothetical protein
MGKERDKDQTDEDSGDRDQSAEEDSSDDKDIDPKNRGERPDNLHRRSDWFQKRHGGG